MKWPFKDAANTAVFTSRRILNGEDWIHYITHDEDDGSWQFHPYSGPTPEEEAKIVSLKTMLEIEPRISELADLPLGWYAWRETRVGNWERGETKI